MSHLIIGLDCQHRDQPDQRRVVGKDPTTSVRRPISRLKRSSGFVDRSLVQSRAVRVECQHVSLGCLEHGGDLRQRALELADRVAHPLARVLAVWGGEDFAE